MKSLISNHLLLCTLYVLILFASCDLPRRITSNVKPEEVTDVQLFDPISYISLIEKGNWGSINDSVSSIAQNYLTKNLLSSKEQLHITDEIHLTDSSLENRFRKEVIYMITKIDSKQKDDLINFKPLLDSILDAKGKRFGLIVLSTGFERTNKNFRNQNIKAVGIGVATLGMFTQVPIKNNSTVRALIFDAKDNNVAFYRKVFVQEESPINELLLKAQLHAVFYRYFYKGKVSSK